MKTKRIIVLGVFISLIILVLVLFLIEKKNKTNKRTTVELTKSDLDIVYGADTANITIYMFSSYECVFCRKFFNEVFPTLKKEFIDTGKIRLVVKLVDLTGNEDITNSLKLAVCINKYGNFDKLNQLLLLDPKVVYTNEFNDVLDDLVQKDEFVAECMYGGESEKYILKNLALFKMLGCTGTPTFVVNKHIYKGYRDYENFKKLIEKELANALHSK